MLFELEWNSALLTMVMDEWRRRLHVICNNIYVRAAAYSLDCHGGAVVNHKLYRTFQSSIEHRTESVRSMDHELSVAESSIELGQSMRNFAVRSS